MTSPFGIAVAGDQAFRFEDGPGTTAHVAADVSAVDGSPVEGRDAKRVERSVFESVVEIATWRLAGGAPEPVDVDPIAGHLDDAPLVQVRRTPPLQAATRFPVVAAAEETPPWDPGIVRDAAHRAIAGLAPDGVESMVVECRATVRWSEISATLTMVDGRVRHWSPPVMVGQWLHRWRMAEYAPGAGGAWHSARLEFAADGGVRHAVSRDEPAWLVPPSESARLAAYADELRLLPLPAEAIPPWLLTAALRAQQGTAEPEHDGVTELVRLFDGRDGRGRPVWYRPMVTRAEHEAIARYLAEAPLVLSSRGLSVDELAGGDEPMVPMGFHTDGRWVWPSAAAHYLREHGVPPVPHLVDHIRQRGYRLPTAVPTIALDRAAALAMGRPWDDAEADDAAAKALVVVDRTIRTCATSPRRYSVYAEREGAWNLVRDGDWYRVQWSHDRRTAVRFPDIAQAAAYLAGQLTVNSDELRLELDEEFPPWQSPLSSLSPLDPPPTAFAAARKTRVEDLEVDRYGTPDGNLVYPADTPFELRGLPDDHAGREYHRYRLKGEWQVVALTSEAGGQAYLLPMAITHHMGTGHIEEIVGGHPGLPPITDAMRDEAARNPGGWVYCADPDIDPRYIEGVPHHTILGGYKVGPDGAFTGEAFVNDEYRPSPRKRGFPEPQSEFELVLGYIAAGWLPHERIIPAALDAPFQLETDGNGGLRIGVDADGRRFLAVYSSPRYVPADATAVMQTEGRGLLPALAGVVLIVNPGGGFGIELPGDDLIAAAAR